MEGPFGSLIERIIEWMDEFYSIRLAGDVSRGMTEKALRGGYQSRPPLGYRLSRNSNVHGELELYAPEVSIVQNIFSWYTQDGLSPYSIARKLNAMGLSTSQAVSYTHLNVYILRRYNLAKVNSKAVSEHQHIALFQVWLNRLFVQLSLLFIIN